MGVEVDDIYKSLGGGNHWVQLSDLGKDPMHGDIHGMALIRRFVWMRRGFPVYCRQAAKQR